MKLLRYSLWASAFTYAHAFSEALLYLSDFERPNANSKATSILPDTARLLLAQRLGLGQYYELGDANEPVLEILNEYGGRWQSFFDSEDKASNALLIIEGVEHPEGDYHLSNSHGR